MHHRFLSALATPSYLSVIDSTPPWDLETLWKLDWKRFQEVVSMVLAKSGFATEILWVKPNGTTVLAASRQGPQRTPEALVQCAGWNQYEVGVNQLLEFHKAVEQEGCPRAIYVTPGRFDEKAVIYARSKRIELIDGAEFLRTLERMSHDEQQWYRRMALVGSWDVPSCVSCGGKLALREIAFPSGPEHGKLADLTLKADQRVAHQVYCRHLIVKAGVDVLFLTGVEAESAEIHGRVMGNLVCRGKLTVAAGACVSGMVAARSIKLDEGGLLEAEARILNTADVQPVSPQPKQYLWKCPQVRCKGSLPVR